MSAFNIYRKFKFLSLPNALPNFYHELGLSDPEFLVIIQLESFASQGNNFPSEKQIASRSDMRTTDVGALLQNLIEKNMLKLVQKHDQAGKIQDEYDLAPLYDKLDHYLDDNYPDVEPSQNTNIPELSDFNPLNKLVREFEIEFGRLLSPIEREELAAWLTEDHYDPDVVEMALKQAVLSNVMNFKYIDRILLNWQRLNLRSVEQVENYLGRNK